MTVRVIPVRLTGPSGAIVESDVSSVGARASCSDLPVPGDQDPLYVPASGSVRSYWVTVRLRCVEAPSAPLANIVWYCDGDINWDPGVQVRVAKASQGADGGYRQATGVLGVSGNTLSMATHSGLDAEPVDAETFTSSSPLALGGTLPAGSTGLFGDALVYQVVVDPTASRGGSVELPDEIFRFQMSYAT